MSLTAEQIEKSRADFIEFKSRITHKADPDCSCVEFFLDGKLFTTWSYDAEEDDAVDEFFHVMYAGWLARQETLCVELPFSWNSSEWDEVISADSIRESIETAGIAHK